MNWWHAWTFWAAVYCLAVAVIVGVWLWQTIGLLSLFVPLGVLLLSWMSMRVGARFEECDK